MNFLTNENGFSASNRVLYITLVTCDIISMSFLHSYLRSILYSLLPTSRGSFTFYCWLEFLPAQVMWLYLFLPHEYSTSIGLIMALIVAQTMRLTGPCCDDKAG
ncbi:hypothetical protein C8Q69DRAFT_63674 [Paecilomyces variotii]|uniref:Uncharacterized protein n=1 Tax=Byssochlamys spectabilis TaxID=264951 RepID=A0A443HN29_BYSSP|nr:hypothetical protein C8Q69DRAFT_63674 [Paecilomyces variotii]RWQ93228.1 hypothetical protein C8Q69DRAFT_63674 [Paecilomyces variotii]